jgi:hypothetical protein
LAAAMERLSNSAASTVFLLSLATDLPRPGSLRHARYPSARHPNPVTLLTWADTSAGEDSGLTEPFVKRPCCWEQIGGGLVPPSARRSAMVEVGDRVLVESEKVGTVTRGGVVTAVDGRLITVRWDSGGESIFVPSAGSLQVTGHEPPAGEADSG